MMCRYVLPFRGNAFIDSKSWTGSQIPTVINCSSQIASDPNDIDFDITGCISSVSQTKSQNGVSWGTNWLYGFQSFHAAADALFLINQVQKRACNTRTVIWYCFNGAKRFKGRRPAYGPVLADANFPLLSTPKAWARERQT